MTDGAQLDGLLDEARAHGAFSAVSLLIARHGEVVHSHIAGVTRTAGGAVAMREVTPTTRFDLASLTKPVVATALLRSLLLTGDSPDELVDAVLPELAGNEITFADLLSHSAGFAPEWWDRDPDPDAERFRLGARPVPGAHGSHVYSCVGYIWAGIALARREDVPLDDAVRALVLDPLGMTRTGYTPASAIDTVATEIQPGRGLVHGSVHDETAAALGGVSGNAGLFGTAHDLLRFLEALRNGSLGAPVVAALTTPVVDGPGYRQSLGLRTGDAWMGTLASGFGHTGFTGGAMSTRTSDELSVVFLTNRVHPHRELTDLTDLRSRVFTAASSLRS